MADHYFSRSEGDVGGAGTEADPLSSISPLDDDPSNFATGDTILLKAGDVWREGLVVPQSGDSSGDFTVTSYGTTTFGVGGRNLIRDWSFEEWSNPTTLVKWEQTNLGGGSYASFIKQAATPHHKALAVTMRCEDPYPPGGVISVSQVVGDLEDNETYQISLFHKEHLNDNVNVGYNQWGIDFHLKIMVERRYFSTAGEWVIEFWKDGDWSEGQGGEVFAHSLSWVEATHSFETGDNPNGAGAYRLHILPNDYGIATFGESTDGSFNVDVVSLSKTLDGNPVITGAEPVGGWAHGTSGVNLLTDPSFEDWANNTDLTSWAETEIGGTSYIDRETTEVYLGSESVHMSIVYGDAASISQDDLALDDATEYSFSVYHKEDLSVIYTGLDLLVSRTDSAGSATEWLHGYDTWGATQGDHWIDNRIDWTNDGIIFNTGANPNALDIYTVHVATSYDYIETAGADFYVDAAVLSKTETQNLLVDASFENWTSATDLVSWTERIAYPAHTECTIERSPDGHTGRNSVLINSQCKDGYQNQVPPAASVSQELADPLTDNTRYRMSCYHKEPGHSLYARIFIARTDTDGVTYEYWDTETETWLFNKQPTYYNSLQPNSQTWAYGYIDFDTGANANGYYFYEIIYLCSENLALGTLTPHHYYFDDARLVKIGNGELLTDPSFENWTGTDLDSWTIIQEGDTRAYKSDVRIFDGNWGVSMYLEEFSADPSDVGVYQTGIPLEASTTYRVGVWHHEESYRSNYPECALKLKRESDSYYWTGSAWSPTEQDATSEHQIDFALLSMDVTTESTGNDTYTLTIHRDAGTSFEDYRMFIDHATVHEKDKEEEVYQAYFASPDGDPKEVYVDGELWGETVENLVLFDETDLLDSDETDHPHLYCWSYDSTNDILYVNLGTDPGKLTVEASVREIGVDFNGESYITLDDVTVQRFWGDGVDMGYTSGATPRQTNLTVSNSHVLSSGKAGIVAGYHPPDPATGDPLPTLIGYTPANITIEDCEIRRYARNRDRHVTLDDATTYRVPNGGIKIFPSSDAGAVPPRGPLVEDVIIRRNLVDGEWYMHNRGGDRNGIDVHLGEDVQVYDNEVKRSPDHGIVITGQYSVASAPAGVWQDTDLGDVYGYTVKNNHVYDQADDCIWVWGVLSAGNAYGAYKNKVCYNLCHDCTDNGLDISNCAAVEVYGNTFYNCKNEQIALRSWPPFTGDSGAFIFNNVFSNWGTEWVDLPDQPGMRLGVAIGIQTRKEGTLPFNIDYNFYYQDPDAATVDYPFMANVDGTVDLTQRTWNEWRSMGFDANSQIGTEPQFLDPDDDDFTLYYYSPVFNSGLTLTTHEATITGTIQATYYFDYQNAIGDILEPTTVWPASVVTMAQGSHHLDTGWTIGAFGRYTYAGNFKKDDDGPPFPTDKTLRGVPVYLVDDTNHKIWKGIITDNTFDTLWVDAWEGMFNTGGLNPTGVLDFYLGYIYLYDKTPQYAFLSDQWEKNLIEYELLTNRITTANEIFFKKNINHGDVTDTDSGSLSGDRLRVKLFDGKHRNIQLEHALVTNQEIRIKEITYHGAWTRGKIDQ